MTNLSQKPVFKANLHQLGIAPENIRADDDADNEIDELANTLLAGQIAPLLVRAGGENCLKDWLILDGRRRFLAFETLWDDGRMDSDFTIDCILCETPEEIAAATVVANSSRLEISKADYLLAVNRLMSQFKTPEEIAKILGIEAADVRKVAKLGSVDNAFLQGLKSRKLTLTGLKKIARIEDPNILADLLNQIRNGQSINDWYIHDASDSHITAKSNIVTFFSEKNYLARGGRIESDLFEELPDRMVDTAIVHALWEEATTPIAEALRAEGIEVHHHVAIPGDPAGRIRLDYEYRGTATFEEKREVEKGEECFSEGIRAAREGKDYATYIELLKGRALAQLATAHVEARPLSPVTAVLKCSRHSSVDLVFYADKAEYDAWRKTIKNDTPAIRNSIVNRLSLPHARTKLEVEGFSTLMHQRVTRIAGEALAIDLASNPTAALDAQISAQFQQCMLHNNNYDRTTNLLKVSVGCITSMTHFPEDDIRRPIVERLKAYRETYKASGLYPFEWVQTLYLESKLDLLALITALQVDTYEQKNNELRLDARAEAAHIAMAIGHDIRDHYKPDIGFYGECSKKQLLAFVELMGVDAKPFEKDKRPDLAPKVAELAKEHNFIPPAFTFELEIDDEAPAVTTDDQDDEYDDGEDIDTFDEEEVPA